MQAHGALLFATQALIASAASPSVEDNQHELHECSRRHTPSQGTLPTEPTEPGSSKIEKGVLERGLRGVRTLWALYLLD